MNELDQTDRRLIELLQANGQQSMAELSKAIGVAPSTLNDRVKRLQRLGAITGFHAHAAPGLLGLDLLAFVFVTCLEVKAAEELVRRAAAAPEVLECHHVTGGWDYLLKVRVANPQALEKLLGELFREAAGLQRSNTMVVLSSQKETSALPVAAG
jgi:Lrp/AsnC family leucine-responsive transcriptional regulator